MRSLVVALTVVLTFVGQAGAGLCDAYKIAQKDLEALKANPYEQAGAFYFWLGDIPEAERPVYILVLAGHLQGLSREADSILYVPQVVAADYSVVRINYFVYGWTFAVVRQTIAADPFREYTLRLATYIPWPGGVWPDGKDYKRGDFTFTPEVAVVSASWFVWQTLIQNDRKPGYYDFLGIKDRNDVDALIGFDAKLNTKAQRFDLIEVPEFSRISRTQLRNILIQPVSGRYRYLTEDSRKATRQFDPLTPKTEFQQHEAEEHIFDLPNGYKGFFLGNAAGVRQDFAPAEVVGGDRSSPSNDVLIHVGLSCLRCHFRSGFKGSAGLIDFVPHFRNPETPVTTTDPFRKREFDRAYMVPYGDEFVISRLRTQVAVIQSTGLTADDWALRLTTWFEKYDAGATLTESAAFLDCKMDDLYLGVDQKTKQHLSGPVLQEAMKVFGASSGLLDRRLSLFARGKIIPRENYHEIYHVLRTTLKGMRDAKVFDPAGVFPAPGAPGYDIKQWLEGVGKPARGILPPIPQLPKLQSGLLRPAGLQLQFCLSGSDPAVQLGLRGAERCDFRPGKLQPADRHEPVERAVAGVGGERLGRNRAAGVRSGNGDGDCGGPAAGEQRPPVVQGSVTQGRSVCTAVPQRLCEVSFGSGRRQGVRPVQRRWEVSGTEGGRHAYGDLSPDDIERRQADAATAFHVAA